MSLAVPTVAQFMVFFSIDWQWAIFFASSQLHVRNLIWIKGEVGAPWNRFKPSSKTFLLTVPRRYFFCGSFVLFMSCGCHAFPSVHCCLVVTWRERAVLLALVCDVYCDFVTFPSGILGQVWYLIISIPYSCRLSYFDCFSVVLHWTSYTNISDDSLMRAKHTVYVF